MSGCSMFDFPPLFTLASRNYTVVSVYSGQVLCCKHEETVVDIQF